MRDPVAFATRLVRSCLHRRRVAIATLIAFAACSNASPALPPVAASLPADRIVSVEPGRCDPPIDGVIMSHTALSDLIVGAEEEKRPLRVALAQCSTERGIAEAEAAAARASVESLTWRATWMPIIAGSAGIVAGALLTSLLATALGSR